MIPRSDDRKPTYNLSALRNAPLAWIKLMNEAKAGPGTATILCMGKDRKAHRALTATATMASTTAGNLFQKERQRSLERRPDDGVVCDRRGIEATSRRERERWQGAG